MGKFHSWSQAIMELKTGHYTFMGIMEKENGSYYLGISGYIGIMEENGSCYLGFRGFISGYIGIMEKKMEATI